MRKPNPETIHPIIPLESLLLSLAVGPCLFTSLDKLKEKELKTNPYLQSCKAIRSCLVICKNFHLCELQCWSAALLQRRHPVPKQRTEKKSRAYQHQPLPQEKVPPCLKRPTTHCFLDHWTTSPAAWSRSLLKPLEVYSAIHV